MSNLYHYEKLTNHDFVEMNWEQNNREIIDLIDMTKVKAYLRSIGHGLQHAHIHTHTSAVDYTCTLTMASKLWVFDDTLIKSPKNYRSTG